MELPILTKLRKELKEIERELRIDVPNDLRIAVAHGDLRENSEYEAAKHRQSFLQARAGHMSRRINMLTSLNLEDIPKDVIGFGSKIYLEDMDSGDEVIYELVTPEEVDPTVGKISVSSPIGTALLNKEEGDDITIALPSGTKEYGVTRVETIHDLFLKDLKD
jgi:transcription elongation factor GreA